MEATDINIFFFGTPSQDFSSYPKKYVNQVNAYDRSTKDNELICTHHINSNKFIINYVEYGISGISPRGKFRAGKNFGLRIELTGYQINVLGQKNILPHLKEFIKEGIKNQSGIFDDSRVGKHYVITSFGQVSDRLDKMISIYKEHFLIDFEEHIIPIKSVVKEGHTHITIPKKTIQNRQVENTTLVKAEKEIDPKIKNKNKIDKGNKRTRQVFQAMLFIILLFIFYEALTFCSEFINSLIYWVMIGLFLIMIIYKFVVKNTEKIKKDVDNKFIATVTLLGFLALILKAILFNNGNFSNLICNSIHPYQLIINTLDKKPVRYVLCFDNSGSGRDSQIDRPGWYSQKNIDAVLNSLNIEKPNYNENPLAFNPNRKKISNLIPMKLKALKLLTTFTEKDTIDLILFGNNSVIDSNLTKKEVGQKILDLEAKNEHTNFEYLFKKLNEGKNKYKDIYEYNPYNIVIFSDFLHDDTNYDKVESEKNIRNYLDTLSLKAIDLNFTFFETELGNNMSQVINVKDIIIEEFRRKKRNPQFFNKNQYLDISVYSCARSKQTLQFPYGDNSHDEIISNIEFDEKNNLNYAYFNFNIDSNLDYIQYYYCKENSDNWVAISNKDTIEVKMNETLRIKCKGSHFTSVDKINFTAIIPSKKIKKEISILFTTKTTKEEARLIISILAMLLVFELIYIKIIIQRALQKTKYKTCNL